MTGRALVIGGGGATGVAWALGILSGLAAAGVRLADADLMIGTSAGAMLGSQLAGGVDAEELYLAQLDRYRGDAPTRMGRGALAKLAWALTRYRDPRQARATVGRMALAAHAGPEATRRRAIESRLIAHDWPERRLLITAVDAVSGDLVTFDRHAGVPLVDAVAASCAVPGVWPPVDVAGRRFIDGGLRSPANADLADGCDRVVVLAPITRGFGPVSGVVRQVAELSRGPRVVLISPDPASRRAIGPNPLDPAHRPAAARAGRAQAARVAGVVAAAWCLSSVVTPRIPAQRRPSSDASQRGHWRSTRRG
jgi:NTE family protein